MTWKELKAQGIKRCCAMFKNGKQCARRVADNNATWSDLNGSYCAKHAPIMQAWENYNKVAIKGICK